ncbi:MAG: putative signal transducing protein [Caulobacterales bacterium]
MGLALITRIPSLVEAQIAAGALRSAGIAVEVFDANFGAIEAPVIEGLGGYRLMAPEEQVAAARDALRALRASPGLGDPEDNGPWTASLRRSTGVRARGMRVIAILYLGLPLLVWLIFRLTHR